MFALAMAHRNHKSFRAECTVQTLKGSARNPERGGHALTLRAKVASHSLHRTVTDWEA